MLILIIIKILQRIHWSSSDEDRELCLIKGKGEDDCQNYIRVLARVDPRTILVCGTNSFNPLCRHYTYTDGRYTVQKQFSGKGYAPYDPRHNSTSLYTGMLPMTPGTTPHHCIQVWFSHDESTSCSKTRVGKSLFRSLFTLLLKIAHFKEQP